MAGKWLVLEIKNKVLKFSKIILTSYSYRQMTTQIHKHLQKYQCASLNNLYAFQTPCKHPYEDFTRPNPSYMMYFMQGIVASHISAPLFVWCATVHCIRPLVLLNCYADNIHQNLIPFGNSFIFVIFIEISNITKIIASYIMKIIMNLALAQPSGLAINRIYK